MILKASLMFLLGIVVMGAILLLPAGSFGYWHVYIYLFLIFAPMFFSMVYFTKHDPELLKRRMNYKEKEVTQKSIMRVMGIVYLIGFLVPGFDFRFGWSSVPLWLVIVSDVMIFLGYVLVIWVMKVNSFASRNIQVEKGQKVVTTGPYAIVRHPMYVGAIMIFFFTPFALDSLWAVIPFVLVCLSIIPRLLNEEKVLEKELDGYKEYTKKCKYRLIPGIW